MTRPTRVGLSLVALLLLALLSLWLHARPYTANAEALHSGASLRSTDTSAGLSLPEAQASDAPNATPQESPPLPEGVAMPARPQVSDIAALGSSTPYLLAGLDRSHSGRFGRTDSLLVAFFEDETQRVGVVSIPRDLYVDVPGHGPARINATLRIAQRLGLPPLQTLLRVVSDTLSVRIQHAIAADLGVFESTVDALGGIAVRVPCPIIDNFIDARAPGGRRPLRVEVGEQNFDGVTAAMYVRSRHGRSDWSRARRQQAVLVGLRGRIRGLSLATWAPALQRALSEGVVSTMSRLELLSLVNRVRDIDTTRLHGILIGSREVTQHRTEEGRSVLLPNYPAIRTKLRSLFSAPTPGSGPARRPCPRADAAISR